MRNYWKQNVVRKRNTQGISSGTDSCKICLSTVIKYLYCIASHLSLSTHKWTLAVFLH